MSPVLKKRLRVYAFSAGIVVALMAGVPPLSSVEWPKAIIAILGLVVGILNIRGKDQMDRYLIAAIGLKVTVAAFLGFSGVTEAQKAMIINFEIFITAGLLYVALVSMYSVLKTNFNTYKLWVYIAAVILVVGIWLASGTGNQSLVTFGSIGLLLLGLFVGFTEGPKNPDEGNAKVGVEFVIAAVAYQLSSSAVSEINVADFTKYEGLINSLKLLLEKSTIFTTSALLVIAFMAIFWVLDEITDN